MVAHNDHFLLNSTKSLCKHTRTGATRCCQNCSEWVHPCSSLKVDWVFLFTRWLWNAWTASNTSGLAWLFSAWLAQILLLIIAPDLNTLHITVKTTQSTAQLLYMHTFLLFSIFHTGELKRPTGPESFCRAQAGRLQSRCAGKIFRT